MRTTVSLGICVLCCLVALIAAEKAEIFGYESNDKHSTAAKNEPNLAKPANYGAGANNLEPVLEYVPNDLAVNEHQHEKRETMMTHPSTMESLQAELQHHLRGRRLPFYVEEPRYIMLRRPSPVLPQSDPGFAFIPQRGRKSDPLAALDKRELSIKQMLDSGDYFVPNRGKKRAGNGIIKKVKFDDILGSDELFIPNRGKKEFLDLFAPSFGGGRMVNDLQPYFSKKNVLNAIQNGGNKESDRGELFYPTRGKKNVLDNLAQSQDTFFSSRGKRNPIIWSMLNEELNPWEYLTDDDGSFDADLALDRYQTNQIIT